MDTIWLWLDRISIMVGILLAIPILWTWWQVAFGEHRQRRKWLAEIVEQPGSCPGVQILDLLPGKNASVRACLAANAQFHTLPEARIVTVQRDKPLAPREVEALAQELRGAARRLLDAGCDVIHFFTRGRMFPPSLPAPSLPTVRACSFITMSKDTTACSDRWSPCVHRLERRSERWPPP